MIGPCIPNISHRPSKSSASRSSSSKKSLLFRGRGGSTSKFCTATWIGGSAACTVGGCTRGSTCAGGFEGEEEYLVSRDCIRDPPFQEDHRQMHTPHSPHPDSRLLRR